MQRGLQEVIRARIDCPWKTFPVTVLGIGSLFSGDSGAGIGRARNIWLAVDFASACIGDDDVIHVESAAYGLIEVHGSFNQIDLGAQLVALRGGQVARSLSTTW